MPLDLPKRKPFFLRTGYTGHTVRAFIAPLALQARFFEQELQE